MADTLRLVLGDQLSPDLASLRDADPAQDVVLLAEVAEEATYVRHHKKKIAFLFAAMRHFAAELAAGGLDVRYTRLDDPANSGSLYGEVARLCAELRPRRVVVTAPGEWRLLDEIRQWQERLGLPVEIREDDRFLASHAEFAAWATRRKSYRMEFFYRVMRQRLGLLLDASGAPEGGRWNFDAENRKPLPGALALTLPQAPAFPPDGTTAGVLALVADRFGDHFGDLEPFDLPVTRPQASSLLAWFLRHALPGFGDYQDAMKQGEPFLFHSRISACLNCGLLDPLEVCRAAEAEYRAGRAPLNAVEGFIRQIVGWREYVRGIYWLKMPDYAASNALAATRPLPWFYWSGETDMNCIRQVVAETRRHAYAHHIQRLMVTGNFALLAGIAPAEVEAWYLAVYADAYDWVELPNTHGMALYADGGLLASKPYAASGKYIDRMSDYCAGCRHDVRALLGERACPFNALYWDFLLRNRSRLEGNPRLAMPYRTLAAMTPDKRAAIAAQAAGFLAGLSPSPPPRCPDSSQSSAAGD